MSDTYMYAFGFRTRVAAELSILDMLAGSEISLAEKPAIEIYWTPKGAKRWGVTLEAAL